MYIKLYRLVDGTQVVGKEEKHYIKDVLQVTMTQKYDQSNQPSGIEIGLVPLLFPFQEEHKGTDIDKAFSISSIDCPNAILNIYLQATSNATQNIQLPTLEPIEKVQQGPLWKKHLR